MRKYLTEGHAHTKPVSHCSDILPSELVKIYKEHNYDCIVLTNHFNRESNADEFMDGFDTVLEAGKKEGIRIILGMEIRFSNEGCNDYLVYGIDRADVYKAESFLQGGISDFYKGFKNDNNVIIQAHPFRDGMTRADDSCIDGIEVFNMHPNHNSRIGIAARYAMEHENFIVTCGTDFHHHGQEAMCATITDRIPKDSFDFAKILKSGEYEFKIGDFKVIPRVK